MQAIGIVFLFNEEEGSADDVSKNFAEHFAAVTENFVRQELMDLVTLKKIIDEKKIYWAAVKSNFNEVVEDPSKIGDLAWQVFQKHTNIEAAEDVEALVYDGSKAPWGFTLISCVLYQA